MTEAAYALEASSSFMHNSIHVNKNVSLYYAAQLAFSEGTFELAIKLGNQILQSGGFIARRQAARLIANSFLQMADINNVCSFIVHQYIQDNGSIYMLPIEDTVSRLDKKTRARSHYLRASMMKAK